jgi:hypothetical protein
MWNHRGAMTMAGAKRRPANRRKAVNFQVRMRAELVEAFDAMMSGDMEGVANADDEPMTRTDLVGYWARWITGLPPEGRREWARIYRDWHMDRVRKGGVAPGSGTPAVKGKHTVGRVVSLDEGVQPGKVRRRPDRDKMDAESAR